MRELSIDEKVSIKGQLATKGVLPCHLVRLNTETALYFWWRCFGTPISLHSTGKRWHKILPGKFGGLTVSELQYIPVAEYDIGLCYYEKTEPYKTVTVKGDSLRQAMEEGRKLLSPSIIERVRHIATRPNPEHLATMSNKPRGTSRLKM